MIYSKEKLEEIIQTSCEELFINQPMLFSKKDNVNEQTVSTELSKVLSKHFEKYHVNCEYNRMFDKYGKHIEKKLEINDNNKLSSVFPDIIVHRQEDNLNNILAIEMKMSWKNKGKEHDIEKLKLYVRDVGYKFAIYLELGELKITEMQWFLQPYSKY